VSHVRRLIVGPHPAETATTFATLPRPIQDAMSTRDADWLLRTRTTLRFSRDQPKSHIAPDISGVRILLVAPAVFLLPKESRTSNARVGGWLTGAPVIGCHKKE